jgi:hypothetical protein
MRLFPLLFLILLITGCSSTGWIKNNPVFSESGVYLHSFEDTDFTITPVRVLPEIEEELSAFAADSLGRTSLIMMTRAYDRGELLSVRYTNEISEAVYELRVEEIQVQWIATMNFPHPGPNFRVRVHVTGWSGENMVFESRKSHQANLASVVADGRRFYIPTDEEKNDPEIQRQTIYPALRSAFGKVWQDFLQAGKRAH